MPANIRF